MRQPHKRTSVSKKRIETPNPSRWLVALARLSLAAAVEEEGCDLSERLLTAWDRARAPR
jgi:hypothetical protein